MYDSTKKSLRLDNIGQLQYQLAATSPEFEETVISHVLGNYMDASPFPLFLSIHGPKGEGKTFQTLRSCAKYGINIYYVSGAELCGSYEKDSIALIQQNLNEAILNYRTNLELSVVVIDDFHLSIASVNDGVAKTVNSQILTGWLMNISDRSKAERKSRIPFILLGNDFSNLYPPLTRDGRMDFYEWKPSAFDKEKMICAHFEDYIRGDENWIRFKNMIRNFPTEPISFFAELKNDLLKCQVKRLVQTTNITNAIELLKKFDNVSEEVLMCESFDIVGELEKLAEKRKEAMDAKMTTHESRRAL